MTRQNGGGLRRAVVIGGSVGGLFAGNLLRRKGWQVDILERVRDGLESRGTGIARHKELEEILALAGIRERGPTGIQVDGRVAYDRSGKITGRYLYPQELGAWNRVYKPLLEAFPADRYHTGAEFVGFSQDERGVEVRLSDGRRFKADVLLGADGFRSAVRATVAPEIKPIYSGYVAWRGMVEEGELSSTFRSQTFPRYAFLFPVGSQFIGYPMGGEDGSVEVGKRRYTYLWYYPVSDVALQDLLTDAAGITHEYSIAPPLIRPSHIRHLREEAENLLPPQFAEVVLKARQHLVQPIYDVDSDRMAFGRLALLGDAAFVARPHVGVGVLKAAQDALALSAHLSREDDPTRALLAYESERLAIGKETVAFARHLGAFIERGLPGPEADPLLALTPEKIIRVSGRPLVHQTELLS